MSDTAPRNAVSAPQMLADALLRSLTGASAQLRMTSTTTDTNMSELGLTATSFVDAVVSPVALRKLRPAWKSDGAPQWELLVSATAVAAQVNALDLSSAAELFKLTLLVAVGGQDYLIESVTSNEAFGKVYLYRLLLREARPQSV